MVGGIIASERQPTLYTQNVILNMTWLNLARHLL